jgi:ubiquinone/menaquinone biosynthesis C-methylase UbiE
LDSCKKYIKLTDIYFVATAKTYLIVLSIIRKLKLDSDRGIQYSPTEKILDSGCGDGLFIALAKQEMGIDIVGSDVNEYKNKEFVFPYFIANHEFLPIKDNSLSIVVSNFVLEHMSDKKKYLLELKRVLKNDGRIVLSVPTQYWHVANLIREFFHLIFNPLDMIKLIKNPFHYLAHEKSWCINDSKKEITFLDEMRQWHLKNWESLFRRTGLAIDEVQVAGEIFDLIEPFSRFHYLFSNLSLKLRNSRYGISATFILSPL